MYLFGYGSLININSAQKSFERILTQKDLIPATLSGFKKVWNAIEIINFDPKQAVNGVFLNLEYAQGTTNGVIIKINEKELEDLKKREKNYSCIEIPKEKILNLSLDENVITFCTQKKDKLAKKGDENYVIAKKYIEILTASYKSYDSVFVEKFHKSINNFPFTIQEGSYFFHDPIQNKFAQEGING